MFFKFLHCRDPLNILCHESLFCKNLPICFYMSKEDPGTVREYKASKTLEGAEGLCRHGSMKAGGARVQTEGSGNRGRGRGGWQQQGGTTAKPGCTRLLSWQHDAERLRLQLSSTLDNMLSRQQNAPRTHGRRPCMRSWGARNPQFKAGYTGCAITLPPTLNAHTLHPQILPWPLHSLQHSSRYHQPHWERGEIISGCNDVDTSPGTGHRTLAHKLKRRGSYLEESQSLCF